MPIVADRVVGTILADHFTSKSKCFRPVKDALITSNLDYTRVGIVGSKLMIRCVTAKGLMTYFGVRRFSPILVSLDALESHLDSACADFLTQHSDKYVLKIQRLLVQQRRVK